eukprot:355370-Chlamydomonas_euryale.AAC.7
MWAICTPTATSCSRAMYAFVAPEERIRVPASASSATGSRDARRGGHSVRTPGAPHAVHCHASGASCSSAYACATSDRDSGHRARPVATTAAPRIPRISRGRPRRLPRACAGRRAAASARGRGVDDRGLKTALERGDARAPRPPYPGAHLEVRDCGRWALDRGRACLKTGAGLYARTWSDPVS